MDCFEEGYKLLDEKFGTKLINARLIYEIIPLNDK